MNAQPDETKIACPHCGQHILIEASMLGTELQCPTCNQSFTAPEADAWSDGEANVGIEAVETDMPGKIGSDVPENADSGCVETESTENTADETPAKRNQMSVLVGQFSSATKRVSIRVFARVKKSFSVLPRRNRRIVAFSSVAIVVVLLLWSVVSSGGTIKLPPVPDGVCIPFGSAKGGSSCIYLGAYRVGRVEYNAFYWPEHDYDGKRKKDTLFLQFVEFEVLPKLGWTAYVQMKGEEIDKFHDACVASVNACREANRKAKGIGRPVHSFDISEKFPDSMVWYYSSDGMWHDSNPAYPGASYMPGEVENGKLLPGTVLLGFSVQRRTTRITGQQGWWTNPPYRMLFGIFLDPDGSDASPIQTFLDFSARSRLNKLSRMTRK